MNNLFNMNEISELFDLSDSDLNNECEQTTNDSKYSINELLNSKYGIQFSKYLEEDSQFQENLNKVKESIHQFNGGWYSFDKGIGIHPKMRITTISIEKIIIDESYGQRNPLSEYPRLGKIKGIILNFNKLQFGLISCLKKPGDDSYYCWDGAGRLVAAHYLGFKEIPVMVCIPETLEEFEKEHNRLFFNQRKFAQQIGPFPKYKAALMLKNPDKKQENNYYKAKVLERFLNLTDTTVDYGEVTTNTPFITGLDLVNKSIHDLKFDLRNNITWRELYELNDSEFKQLPMVEACMIAKLLCVNGRFSSKSEISGSFIVGLASFIIRASIVVPRTVTGNNTTSRPYLIMDIFNWLTSGNYQQNKQAANQIDKVFKYNICNILEKKKLEDNIFNRNIILSDLNNWNLLSGANSNKQYAPMGAKAIMKIWNAYYKNDSSKHHFDPDYDINSTVDIKTIIPILPIR